MLCSMSYEAQKAIEKQAKSLRYRIQRRKTDSVPEDAKILMPDNFRRDAFAVLVTKGASREERFTRMENIAHDAFGESDAKRCLVIAFDTLKKTYPYQTLAVFERGEL